MKQVFLIILAVGIVASLPVKGESAKDWKVPADIELLQIAVEDSAEAGDTVTVSNNLSGNAPYAPFTMKSGVWVRRAIGESPKIDAGNGQYAVEFPSGCSSSTILEGFAVAGGDSAVVLLRSDGRIKDCAITSIGATTSATHGIVHLGTSGDGEIRDVTVVLDSSLGDATGIYIPYGAVTLDGFSVVVEDGVYGVQAEDSIVRNGFVLGGAVGIAATGGNYANRVVEYCTVDSAGTVGITQIDGVPIRYCIATNSGGIDDFYATTGATSYCIGYPLGFSDPGTANSTDAPLYCDATNGAYTLRVDSYGNPENNASGERIGAFDVACMYGTLARDASYSAGGTLEFPGDLTIPSGKTLTLGDATVVEATALSDNQSTGDTGRTELFVYGTLVSDGGTTGIEFRSDDGSVFDWGKLEIKAGGAAEIDSTTIRDAGYGLVYASTESGFVTDCTFTNNSDDIIVGSSSGSMDLEISGCTVDKTGTGGNGVFLLGYHDGVTLEGNTVIGSSGAASGIYFASSSSGVQADLVGNTIYGFSSGSGIRVEAGVSPELRGNTILDCLYGIRVDNGNPAVGTGSSSSDNFIHDNGYGVYAISSSAAPAIRNSRIYDNDRGVYCISNGAAHLGDGATSGNNSITGNGYSVGAIHYCRHVVNRSTGVTIPAVGNWWGSCAAPPDSCFMGSVTRTGWLCSQPAGEVGPALTVQSPATSLRVLGAYPNPLTSSTVIRFSVPEGHADIQAHVYDVAGRRVRDLGIAGYGPGDHGLSFDGRDDRGRPLPGGIYFIRLAAGRALVATGRLLVVR